jgi:uncharacterized protein CbrC (UPF0167 family)
VLPRFKYHPDPVATGSLVVSDRRCACCGEVRGFIYTGPAYAVEDYDDCICPWCIADGSAREKLDVTFTCEWDVGCAGMSDPIPREVVEEVAYRTPGFQGWEQPRWWAHCGDAAVFLGRAGREELEDFNAVGSLVKFSRRLTLVKFTSAVDLCAEVNYLHSPIHGRSLDSAKSLVVIPSMALRQDGHGSLNDPPIIEKCLQGNRVLDGNQEVLFAVTLRVRFGACQHLAEILKAHGLSLVHQSGIVSD